MSSAMTMTGGGQVRSERRVWSRLRGPMKFLLATLRILFWLAVGVLPLLLIASSLSANGDGGCWPGSSCWSEPLVRQVEWVGNLARILFWPLMAWNLGGRWLWKRLRRATPRRPVPVASR